MYSKIRPSARRSVALAALLATSQLIASSGCAADEGLKVGDKAPAIELKNQNAEVIKVSEMLKDGPVAVVFHRSANW